MKITKSQLKQIIKEEMSSTLDEKAQTYTFTIDKGGKVIKVHKLGKDAAMRASKKLAKMHGKKAVTVDPPLDEINEDGHEDVPSAARKLKSAVEDATNILAILDTHPEANLPSWWMSKITLASDYLNKARDYALYDGEPLKEEELDEKIKKVDGGYYVTSKSGKHLSKKPHKTKKAALAQLGAVEASKAGRTK